MTKFGSKLAVTGVSLAAIAIASPAVAQDADSNNVAEAPDSVIIVTATRRAQDIQDVPIAVTAVSPEQLANQGVVEVRELAQVAPSFSAQTAQTASTTPTLRIRGVGTAGNNIGFESAVGIFVDGAYQSRPGVALSELVDIERVEVLRGPQGTLFGRNTSAGALNITTNRPDVTEFGGFANATYGNFDLISVQGAINAPIIEDTLAVRLTGAYRERNGYVDILDPSGAQIGESGTIDQFLVRAQLGYESEGGVTGRLIFDYSESENQCCSPVEILQSPIESSGLFGLLTGGLDPRGGNASPPGTANAFDVAGGQNALEQLTTTANRLPLVSVEQWGITGELEFPLGDTTDLVLIGSYRNFQNNESFDADFSGLDVFEVDNTDLEYETFTAEVRIQGEAFGGKLNWLVGGFYSDETLFADVSTSLGAGFDLVTGGILGGAFGPAPLALFTGASPALTSTRYEFAQSADSWSVFTHNDFELADGLHLVLGARYSDESKRGSFVQTENTNPTCAGALGAAPNLGALAAPIVGLGCFAFTAPAIPGVPGLPQEFDVPFNDTELIYTGKISYEFDAPVTVYASFTHGFKSGGINFDTTAAIISPVPGTPLPDPTFASEEVDAYEIGLKAQLLDDAVTLNIAGFHQEFTNFQVLDFNGLQFASFNVGEALSTGLEIESVIRPTSDLTFNLAVTYVDARYPSDCAGGSTSPNVLALCGNSLSNAPQIVTVAGVNYDKDIGSNLRGFLSAQARLVDDQRTGTQAVDVNTGAPRPFDVLDSHTKVNLRAGIGAQDQSWTLEVWGVNVTDVITYDFAFNPALRGSTSAFPNQPATYGVTLRTQF